MPSASFVGTIRIGSLEIQANVTRDGVGEEVHEPPMPAGVAGELTTRTDDDEATLTMPEEHNFETGDIVAVFWTTAAGVPCVIYGFAATVSGASVAIAPSGSDYVGYRPDNGTPIVLPAEGTAIVVAKKVVSDVDITASKVLFIGCGCAQPAVGIFGAATAVYPVQIPVALSPVSWDKESGAPTPLTGNITKLVCYNGGLDAATFPYGFLLET